MCYMIKFFDLCTRYCSSSQIRRLKSLRLRVPGIAGGPQAALQNALMLGLFSYVVDTMQMQSAEASSRQGSQVRFLLPHINAWNGCLLCCCAAAAACQCVELLPAFIAAVLPADHRLILQGCRLYAAEKCSTDVALLSSAALDCTNRLSTACEHARMFCAVTHRALTQRFLGTGGAQAGIAEAAQQGSPGYDEPPAGTSIALERLRLPAVHGTCPGAPSSASVMSSHAWAPLRPAAALSSKRCSEPSLTG